MDDRLCTRGLPRTTDTPPLRPCTLHTNLLLLIERCKISPFAFSKKKANLFVDEDNAFRFVLVAVALEVGSWRAKLTNRTALGEEWTGKRREQAFVYFHHSF